VHHRILQFQGGANQDTAGITTPNLLDRHPSIRYALVILDREIKMRLRHRRSPLLILLIPSLAAGVALASSSSDARDALADTDIGAAAAFADSTASGSTKKYDVGTKDAPVDGKDGRPHEGPFVEIENLRKGETGESKKDHPPLKDRPNDPTIVDGKKIPESNDGVMFDKNRPEPKEGTTGTAGGVSEKDKQRKAKEGKTGEKAENKPDPPKEAPPLPHSEEEKIMGDGKKDKPKQKGKTDGKTVEDVVGFEVSLTTYTVLCWREHSDTSGPRSR
jgi:hypothetical protein